MPEYDALYPEGSRVKIASREILESFMRPNWKYHDPVQPEQLVYAGRTTVVKQIGYYHGGDVLYWFQDIPGTWHEACLKPADS